MPYKYREGRSYEDFKSFMREHPHLAVVEMDTVKSSRDKGKCLPTMIFTKYDFMLVFPLENATQQCVQEVFDYFVKALGINIFRKLFPVILTDNGSEFKNAVALENTAFGAACSRIFYCDPMASWQKPHIERNHEFIRQVLPKKKRFDHLVQSDVTLLANHISSHSRDSLDGLCSYDAAKNFIGKKLPYVLGLRRIKPDDVMLKSSLFN